MIYFVIYAVIGAILVSLDHESLLESARRHDLGDPGDVILVEIVAVLLWPLFVAARIARYWRGRW